MNKKVIFSKNTHEPTEKSFTSLSVTGAEIEGGLLWGYVGIQKFNCLFLPVLVLEAQFFFFTENNILINCNYKQIKILFSAANPHFTAKIGGFRYLLFCCDGQKRYLFVIKNNSSS